MNILVTGGAGYIGSATVKRLVEENHTVITACKSFSYKNKFVDKDAIFYEGDLLNLDFLDKIFSENKIDCVMHFAASKDAGESMTNLEPYSNNIRSTLNVLDTMIKYNVKKIIFSSTGLVYGIPQEKIINEHHPTKPINYYAFSKLKCEEIIKWYSELKGIKYSILRYFNAAGDTGLNYSNEAKTIFSILGEIVSGERDKLVLNGNDHDTTDGTAVRDFIHVLDLVDAFIKCLELDSNEIINLGAGRGYSVLELAQEFERQLGYEIKKEYGPRREGDVSFIVADNSKAVKLLDWNVKRTLSNIVKDVIEEYRKD